MDAPNISSGTTALIAAAKHGHHAAVEALLQNGANAKLADMHGRTALHYAATQSTDLVKMLITAGARVNDKSTSGETALILAVKTGKITRSFSGSQNIISRDNIIQPVKSNRRNSMPFIG